jgi:vesicle coat complex subunit
MAYFTDQKRGEIHELKQALRSVPSERDPQRRRDVVKKVVALMTMGVDVSSLFSDMIMLSSTQDLVQKKMVYHYMTQYAHAHPDIAILTVSTLQRDCKDISPMVRGLALRTMSSLRIKSTVEYLKPLIQQALADNSAYVRAVAVMAAAKLAKVAPSQVEAGSELRRKIREMLGDRDRRVVANVIAFIAEVGESIERHEMHALLNALSSFSEWHQCRILDALARHVPAGPEEVVDILNMLDELLQSSNAGLVLGCARALVSLTANMPKLHKKVYNRLKAPLLTHATCAAPEVQHTVLMHIKLLCATAAPVFANDYRLFFPHFSDPFDVRFAKLDILARVATDATANEIIHEIANHALHRHIAFSAHSIKTIGAIPLSVPAALPTALKMLSSLVDLQVPHIAAQTIVVLGNLLRKFPPKQDLVPLLLLLTRQFLGASSQLQTYLFGLNSSSATSSAAAASAEGSLTQSLFVDAACALLWILGEFGRAIDDAPYVCEAFSMRFSDLDPSVRLELLAASMKLFFVRPPEMQPTLGRILQVAVEDFSHADVHDRGLLYYRLLRRDVAAAQQVVAAPKQLIDRFAEDESSKIRERLFEEFDTLSVVYELPSERFVKPVQEEEEEEEEVEQEQPQETEQEMDDDGALDGEDGSDSGVRQQQSPQALLSLDQPAVDYIGGQTNNLLSMIGVSSSPAAYSPSASSFALDSSYTLDPSGFQRMWGTLEQCAPAQINVGTNDAGVIDASLADVGVTCMATGAMGDYVKAFYYARDTMPAKNVYLMELIVDPQGVATAKVKSSSRADADRFFAPLLRQSIENLAM